MKEIDLYGNPKNEGVPCQHFRVFLERESPKRRQEKHRGQRRVTGGDEGGLRLIRNTNAYNVIAVYRRKHKNRCRY